jgi:hypothetical protein
LFFPSIAKLDLTDRVTPALQLVEMETTDIQVHVTIDAINRGNFGGEEGLQLNNIAELDVPEPVFLTAFKDKLKQSRLVAPVTVNTFFITCYSSYQSLSQSTAVLKTTFDAFPDYFEENSMEPPDRTEGRWADHHELWHLAGAFEHRGRKKYKVIEEDTMWWHFEQLAVYSDSIPNAKDGM